MLVNSNLVLFIFFVYNGVYNISVRDRSFFEKDLINNKSHIRLYHLI